MYRNARYIYRGGTPDFDEAGWIQYVDTHRTADPGLSDTGQAQAEHLAKHLVPHLENQASCPVRIITSPMRRTLETIRPTLEQLQKISQQKTSQDAGATRHHAPKVEIKVVAFYHESEGCHIRDKAEEGMNPQEISELMKDCVASPSDIEFIGFPEPQRVRA